MWYNLNKFIFIRFLWLFNKFVSNVSRFSSTCCTLFFNFSFNCYIWDFLKSLKSENLGVLRKLFFFFFCKVDCHSQVTFLALFTSNSDNFIFQLQHFPLSPAIILERLTLLDLRTRQHTNAQWSGWERRKKANFEMTEILFIRWARYRLGTFRDSLECRHIFKRRWDVNIGGIFLQLFFSQFIGGEDSSSLSTTRKLIAVTHSPFATATTSHWWWFNFHSTANKFQNFHAIPLQLIGWNVHWMKWGVRWQDKHFSLIFVFFS